MEGLESYSAEIMTRIAYLIFNDSPSGLIRAKVYRNHFKTRTSYEVKYFYLYSEKVTEWLKVKIGKFYLTSRLLLLANKLAVLLKQIHFFLVRNQFDKIIIIKYISPFYLKKISRNYKGKIIYDIDDALWLDEYLGREAFENIVSNVHKVLCDNNYLLSYVAKFNSNCSVVPGTSQIENFKTISHRSSNQNSKVQIIWVGSNSTIHFMKQLEKILDRIGKDYPKVELLILGADEKDSNSPVFHNIKVKFIKNYNNEEMIKNIIASHIGLFPLLRNENSLGRGILKLQLYLAGGLATITSSIGGEAENIIVNGENGFLAETAEDWYHYLSLLIENNALRLNVGKNGRSIALKKYSTDVCFHTLIDTIN